MTDANARDETIMRELNDLFISDIDETREEQESFSLHEEAATDDIPPSLISYFETSRSRAAVCEKLILEEPKEDFTTSYEDMMNLSVELSREMVKLKEQVVSETGNENNTSTDSCLLHDPTETEPLVTHNVEVCPNSEDGTGTDENEENEKHLTLKVSIPKTSVIEKEIKETSEDQREHTENQHFEEMKKEEQIRRREKDFHEELKKLMEVEKLHQMELQLMEKRAQEKLEQELLLQQEVISNLQKQVEEERRLMEEEMKRIKEEKEKKKREEEDRKKREEEKIKRKLQIKRMEEEMRKVKEEENRKIKEMKAEEEKRNKEEEKRKKKEEEEKRRREEKNKMEKELRKKEEERKNEIRLKEEEKRRQMEEEERKNKEIGDKIKEKEKNREREEEEETMKREEVIKVTGKKMEGDKKGKNEKEIIRKDDWRKEEGKTRVEEDKTKVEEVRITKELEMKTQQEEKKEGERKSEEERKKAAIEKTMDEQVKKKKEENRQMQLSQDTEKKKNDVERRCSIENKCIMKEEEKMKEEEWKKGHEEEIRQKEEKYIIQINTDIQKYSEVEEEIKIKEGNKTYKADERQMKEELSENKEGTIKTDERRLKEEEESKMIVVQETEKEARLKIANELQEKKQENNSVNTQNERKNRGSTGHPLTSQLEDNSTWTSVGPGPLHSDSSSFEIVQQGDQDRNINKTNDQQDPAVKLNISPSSLLLYLPEHTEQKRLSWMKDCVPWSKLSLQNRRKQKVSVRTQRFLRRAAEASSLPPLCPDTLLQSTGCKSLQEVTTVTLKDLPGCILSSLVQCTQLRSLTMRRCGLKSLEGISQLSELCYIDVEENEISFVNCENMTSLRVLRLGHNKLTSIHGLSGTDNLDVLELSHNNITRIAGLESMRRLQRLSVDHNQLISTKGLRDVYTLLHLNCSHNHLASVEGLENSALLNTLDISANSLTEPPSLDNHVLLRELRLDDNSVSSLQGLSGCWLPLLQHLSVAQNRITQLPSMSDFVSLANLDLRFNCMSELQNVCESLEGCQFLQTIHLTGNPLQQESGWRSTLQKALPGLKAIDDQDTDSFLSHPAVQEISFASVSFLTFCQAQFQQINDFQQQHSRELSKASSSLDAMKSFCQHFTETLKLAEEQRFAHECGDITVSACQTVLEKTAAMESTDAEKFAGNSQKASPADIPSRNDIKCSYWTFEGKSSTESWLHTSDTVTTIPKTGLHSLTTKEKTSSSNIKMAALSNHQDLDLKNSTAAVVIQQQWREYKQKCANINGPPAAEKGGRSGGNPESGTFHINGSVVDQHYAATIIQAFWRGCSVRKRLASALAAVTCPISREDDTFEEVDVDEFVFDEAALEKHWTLQLSEDSSSRHDTLSEQPLSLKFPGSFPDPSHYTLPPPPVWRPKQAWVAGEELDSAGQRVSPESSHRKSPESTSVISGISERSEKILEEWGFTDSHTALLMLKRAQKMKSKQQPKKKHGDPSVRLALFRNCHYQLGPVEARNRPSPHSRNPKKVCKAELGLQQAEWTEQMKQEGSQQWLHTQSDRSAESEHFLPEISSDILNGGRVQLVCVQADPTYTERHHTSGLWASNSLAAQPSKQNSSHRISLGHARKDVPAPKRATSAPSKKERISFRDNPVQLSGGWGGGKKRDKVRK